MEIYYLCLALKTSPPSHLTPLLVITKPRARVVVTVAAATDMAHTHTESAILTCDSYDTTLLQVVAKPCFGTAVNVAAITDEFHIGSEIISLVLGQYYTKPRMGSKHKIGLVSTLASCLSRTFSSFLRLSSVLDMLPSTSDTWE